MYQCVDGFDEIMEYFIKTTTPFDFVSSWEDDGRTWERGCWILLPNFLAYLDRFSLNFFKKTKREEKNNCHPFISSLHEHPICSVPNNLVDVGPKQKGRKRNVVHDTPRQDDGLRSYVLFCCSKSDSILLFLFYFFFPRHLAPNFFLFRPKTWNLYCTLWDLKRTTREKSTSFTCQYPFFFLVFFLHQPSSLIRKQKITSCEKRWKRNFIEIFKQKK